MPIELTRRSVLAGGMGASFIAMGPSAAVVAATKKKRWPMAQGIPDSDVRPATKWLLDNYGDIFRKQLKGTSIPLSLLCAFPCQESAYTWYEREPFTHGRSPAEMMRLLVLDNVSPRGAFPRDTKTFQSDPRYADIAQDLIKISDESRRARGYQATGNLLYGYGLFQYDLQNIVTDPSFWRASPPNAESGAPIRGLWGDVGSCTERFITEFKGKMRAHPGDLKAAVAAYNGSGPNARAYAEIVMKFKDLASAETGD